jgi:type IV secretory pathway protease TraF
MATVNAKAFRVTESSLPILQCFIVEQIPPETKFILASSEGYLFFNEEIPMIDEAGGLRFPKMTVLSYYEVPYENE